ncbi:MAG: DNA polymerase IV [Gammaproteobacteria bacterium]|jgi:DNA polymerase-4
MNHPSQAQRWIAHMDLDAFFTSCEQRDRPAYRGRPVVVGALPGRRGVVAAASYEARRFGIHSAMPIAEAWRRCPQAVYLRPDLDRYSRVSRQVFTVLDSLTPCVEAASIDEAYLDVSGLGRLLGTPEAIGSEIKRRIHAATGLTASVGIGPNRLIAKLGSEHRKPDGLTVIPAQRVLDFLAPMPVSNLRGLGPQTRKILDRLGIHTVAALRDVPLATLAQHLGRQAAENFHHQAMGRAPDRVIPGRDRKSISKETTFETDIREHALLHDTLRGLAADVAGTARRAGLAGAVITLKVRFAGFETHTRQRRQTAPTCDEREILAMAWQLFRAGRLPDRPVRLIGVGLSGWEDGRPPQADLFFPPQQVASSQRLLQTIDAVREKFGRGKLQVGVPRRSGR